MFFIFLFKQVNSFLAEKNICVILCELLNKDYYYHYHYYYYYYYYYNICLANDLIDMWRIGNPKNPRSTWRQKTPVSQRRLDS